MFVKNLSDVTLEYKKNGKVLKIKPGVNLIDVLKWDIQDIKNTYGPSTLAFYEEEDVKVETPVENAPAENTNEGDKEGEGDNGQDADDLKGIDEKCLPCYADGKTPSEEDCEACKAEEAKRLAEEEEAKAKAEAEAKAKAKASAKSKANAKKNNK